MEKDEFDAKVQRWQHKVVQRLEEAPQAFLQAYAKLCKGDIIEAERMLSQCALRGIWPGTASCMIAFIEVQKKEYQQAIMFAESGRKFGIELPGYWYYYYAISEALDYTDQLTDCVAKIDEAIEFFEREDSPADLSDYLYKKANTLKQLAAPISHELDCRSQEHARSLIIEGIRCLCKSLSIYAQGSEQYLKNDLEPILSIAGRTLVSRADLGFLDKMNEIGAISERFFDAERMAVRSCSECFNEAQRLKKDGHREESNEWFGRAINVAPESGPQHRCFKAFVAYQAGVNLLKMCNLEDLRPTEINRSENRREINEIREYWRNTLRLYATVDPEAVAQFDRAFPPGLTEAVWNIKRDNLMKE